MIVDPVFSSWLIVPVITIITIVLVWQESKKNYRFRVLRIFAVILMMLSLAGLALKPSYKAKRSSNIILLTPGYSLEQIDSVLLRHPDLTIMHLDSTAPYRNSKLFSPEELPERGEEIKIVIGRGLPHYYLDNMAFDFIPAPSPQGITDLFISEHNFANRKNTVKGMVNSKHEKGWIYLSGPGGKEDSLAIKSKGPNNFELSFLPKQSGQILYTLSLRDSASTTQEFVPVQVDQPRPLKIFFLNSYPTFETQYLKNFLARKNHSLVLRYQVSKNSFRYEYVNHDQIRIDPITPEVLQNMDLLITDGAAMSSLSPSEKTALEKSIFSGLGLLHLTPITNNALAAFFPFQRTAVKSDTAVLQIGSKLFNFPVRPVRFALTSSTTPIQKNKHGVLSGYTFRGAGKIGFQLLEQTYSLALSGDSTSYAELWSPVVEKISRSISQSSKIKILTPFPWYENEPIDIQVISSKENTSLLADSIPLPLKEHITFDNIWSTRMWVGKPGWHLLQTGDGISLHYYVSDPTGWKTLSLINQQTENKFSAHQDLQDGSKKSDTWEEIPSLIFYIIFLFAAGFIWLAPKL